MVVALGKTDGIQDIRFTDRYYSYVYDELPGVSVDRDRALPPDCEEIDAGERNARAEASRALMRDCFADRHPGEQRTHPRLSE
ncbi:hypothetical protein [Halorhabdus sp. CUG00001]|uniref:hypothetical protein n=1 Tax=Halorhabdus sp. CUG00001 TaxID=2600297 RepID=UPI00131BD052|nr:hypothetical protein [Halorhabdus sp. CUG00001]